LVSQPPQGKGDQRGKDDSNEGLLTVPSLQTGHQSRLITPFQILDLKFFIKSAPENPVLWTGMKGASAKGRRKSNQMLKRVQHDNRVGSLFCHPELVSGSRF
jgi:hypothetical protein